MHLPLLRAGTAHFSLDTAPLRSLIPGAPTVRISQAPAAMVRHDARRVRADVLRELGPDAVMQALQRAAEGLDAPLSLGGASLTPRALNHHTAASTGLPVAVVAHHLKALQQALREMPQALDTATSGLPLHLLAEPRGHHRGHAQRWLPRSPFLGGLLPSNSPGVHRVWLPALALLRPLVLKVGAHDPWTPHRLAAALLAAGLPPQALHLYGGSHAMGQALMEESRAALAFGGPALAARYAGTPGVQVHGPGRSKWLFADGASPLDHLDTLLESMVSRAGRACTNASTLIASSGLSALGSQLAERVDTLEALPLTDPQAQLAAVPAEEAAAWSARWQQLTQGAQVLTGRPLVEQAHGLHVLRPTVVRVPSLDHPLAQTELPWPHLTLIEARAHDAVPQLGPTLVLSLVGADDSLQDIVLRHPLFDRVHLGPRSTTDRSGHQPHEGDIFSLLWRRMAVVG